MAGNRFKDLWLPEETKAIGEKATAQELLEVANGTDQPGEAVYQVGRWAAPGAVNDFAGLLPSVNSNAAGPTAEALGGLLGAVNLDRAVEFAMSQPTDQMRAFAIAGVFDELRSTANGEREIRALYATLPLAVQTADPVLFTYGNAIWGSDPNAALQALEGIASPQTKMLSLLALSRNSASAAPEVAIAAIYASGLSDQGIYNHVSTIIQNWSAVDPQAAAKFLSTTQIIPPADVSKYAPIVASPGKSKG
jgi:hypothetical protein